MREQAILEDLSEQAACTQHALRIVVDSPLEHAHTTAAQDPHLGRPAKW